MKNLILISSLICVMLFSSSIHAQNFEGKIKMKMEVVDVPKEMEQMKAMMESTITTYTKGKKSRLEMSNSMTGNTVVISDLTKNEVVMCMDMMGKKTAVVSNTEEYKTKNGNESNPKMEYTSTNETKIVAGHVCKKTIAKIAHEGEKMEMEIWYAPDIQNTNLEMSDVPGMPLEYSMKMDQFTMHFIASEVAVESVPDSKFEIPADYERMTSEEFQKQMSGGYKGK